MQLIGHFLSAFLTMSSIPTIVGKSVPFLNHIRTLVLVGQVPYSVLTWFQSMYFWYWSDTILCWTLMKSETHPLNSIFLGMMKSSRRVPMSDGGLAKVLVDRFPTTVLVSLQTVLSLPSLICLNSSFICNWIILFQLSGTLLPLESFVNSSTHLCFQYPILFLTFDVFFCDFTIHSDSHILHC